MIENKTVWTPQTGPQTTLLQCPVFEVLYGGARGGGKLQPMNSSVLTPFGWKKIGILKVGDKVIDPTTGGATRVIGIFPQGILPVYKVTCDDGATCEVGLEHLWAYKLPNHHRPRTKPSAQREYATQMLGAKVPDERWNTLTVGTTADLIKALKDGDNPRIPLTEPVLFSVNGRTGASLDPYFLGLFLGDGCSMSRIVTTGDDEIREYLKTLSFVPADDQKTLAGGFKHWKATDPDFKRKLLAWLANHELKTCRAWEKFIPPYVFTANIEYRHAFLQGLMDSDGTVDDRGHCSFCTTSERLAHDIAALVRGLGGKLSINPRDTSYTYKDEKLSGRTAYICQVQIPKTSALFRLTRHKARCTDSWNGGYEMMRGITAIEEVRVDECVCIKVASPYGLYVTDDFIVTHNTDAMLGDFVAHAGQYGEDAIALCVRRERTQLKEMIERSRQIYSPLGAKYSSQDKQWRFPNGARMTFAYLENDADSEAYQGWNTTRVYVEEMGNFPRPEPIFKLMATLRSANPNVKVGFRATANPGGCGHCLSKGEVLTPKGWVDIKEISVGDSVYTIDKKRNLLETTVSQKHESFYSGEIVEISSRGLNMIFTPNHSLAYIPGTKNASPDMMLATVDKLPGQSVIARSVKWRGEDPGDVTVSGVTNGQPTRLSSVQFARLLGWVLSEGGAIKRNRNGKTIIEGFYVTQVKPETTNKLISFLTDDCEFIVSESNGYNFKIYSKSWGELFTQYGLSKDRFIPRVWLDAHSEAQYALFEALVDGDGHWVRYGKSGTFYTSSPRLADDFQELATKLGFVTTSGSRERSPEYKFGDKTGVRSEAPIEYSIYFKTVKSGGTEILTGNHLYDVGTETKRHSDITRKPFSGMVYCIGVEDTHTFLIRQNGSVWISGNSWIKSRYIDPAPQGLKILTENFKNPFTGEIKAMERVFIPSRVSDNKYCNNSDYIARLQMSAGERLLKAWLYGDWNVVEGAFFSEWDDSKHIIKPFIVPKNWLRFCSADWGSAAPFSIGWWAVVGDDDVSFGFERSTSPHAYQGGLPRGAIVRYREWYGAKNHNNVGLKMFAEEVAAGMVERERDEPRNVNGGARIAYRVIDPDACREKGGPSIAERMSWAPNNIFWRPADNSRVGRRGALGGWDVLRARLKGEEGRPMLYVFDTCVDLIRTLPIAQHDPERPEDIGECEDHAIDDVRYACMSRPYIAHSDREIVDRLFTIGPENELTINDVMDDHRKRSAPRSYERIR